MDDNDRTERRDQQVKDLSITIARLEEKLNSSERALMVAKAEIDRRLEEMNEMRKQINLERGTFLGIKEFQSRYEVLSSAIDGLRNVQAMAFGGLFVIQVVIGFVIRFWR